MLRISLKTLLLLVALVAMPLVPLSFFIHHSTTWGPAERTESMLADLCRDADGISLITTKSIDELLETPKYEFLKRHRTNDIALRDGELAWFSPNAKYSIGISQNGAKHWIINGKRVQ